MNLTHPDDGFVRDLRTELVRAYRGRVHTDEAHDDFRRLYLEGDQRAIREAIAHVAGVAKPKRSTPCSETASVLEPRLVQQAARQDFHRRRLQAEATKLARTVAAYAMTLDDARARLRPLMEARDSELDVEVCVIPPYESHAIVEGIFAAHLTIGGAA